MTLMLNLLIICALIVLAPLALAMLLLVCVAAVLTAISDARSRTRMRRSLDELIR